MEFWYDPETIDLSLTDLVPGVDFLISNGEELTQAAPSAAVTLLSKPDRPDEKSGADRPEIRKRCRRATSRLPRAAVRVLEEWLAAHRETPYPSHQMLDKLQAESGLERSQVLNWFANARKRGKARAPPPSPPSSGTSPSQQRLSSLLTHTSILHPMERWLYSGMEQEPVSISDIQDAIKIGQVDALPRLGPSRWLSRTRQFHDLSNELDCNYDESFASSMEIRSYAANARSVSSDEWKCPYDTAPSTTTKSTRRRHRNPGSLASARSRKGEVSGATAGSTRRFQCTFCHETFKRKHDWQRHEKSQHLLLEKWICCPDGSVSVDPGTNEVTCVFCGASDPNPEHVHGHGYTQCINRPLVERTFYRKDHLRQHLRLMHNGCGMMPCMEAWRSAITSLHSRCGFCDSEHETWQARIDHIAEHFRDGAIMADWKGDWGFESDMTSILERATLPEDRLGHNNRRGHMEAATTDVGASGVPSTE